MPGSRPSSTVRRHSQREAGRRERPRLIGFLDSHAREMPRTGLRYAMEHLEPELREHYRNLR